MNRLLKHIFKILNTRKILKVDIKKLFFYIATISGLLMFFFHGLITRGRSFNNLFQNNRSDYFMDFYNPLSELFDGPYAHGSIYPPLPQLFYKFMLRLIPYDIAAHGGFAIRLSDSGQIVFLMYMIITLLIFIILLLEIKKGSRLEKYIFSVLILFSAPFLYQFERANIIFIALLFLIIFIFFKDSKNRIIREIAIASLAVSAGIKLYPLLFSLLLIKERRIKDFFKILFYSAIVLIVPFFILGGLSQLTVLFNNILSTSNGSTGWGVGYSVNIQNITRIIFAIFGNFGDDTIFIGRIFSVLILILGVISVLFLRSKWKTVTLLSLLIVMVPPISFEYTLIFMIIPLIMFLDYEEKEKWIDYLYMACFILIFIPFTLNKIDIINSGFGISARPLTYGVLIQNIAISIMITCLVIQGLIIGFNRFIKYK